MVTPLLCLRVNGIVKAPVNPFTDHLANLLTATVFLHPAVYMIHDDHHFFDVEKFHVTEATGRDGNILRHPELRLHINNLSRLRGVLPSARPNDFI